MRLFVAVPVPDQVRSRLDACLRGVRGRFPEVRWTRADAWHLTLAFLGEVDADRLGRVVAGVDAVAVGRAPFPVALAEAGRFGRRVLWVGLDEEPPGTLAGVGEQVQATLAAADVPVERRAVHPHLTLARAGRGQVTPTMVEAVRTPAARWEVDRLEVWRSHLGRGPARYEVVHAAPLAG